MSNLDKLQDDVIKIIAQARADRTKDMNDLVTRLIRTYTPIIIGGIVSWLITKGVEIDESTKAAAIITLTGFLQALYYTAVSVIAKKFPAIEILLGSKKAPEYEQKK